MFRPIVLLAAIAALGAGPALAADEAPAVPAPAQQPNTTKTPAHCWKENPFNEYRDCVNAATRDPNAKIRMA